MIMKIFSSTMSAITPDPTPEIECKCGCGHSSTDYRDGYKDGVKDGSNK